jgi:hypothetical protein
MKLSAKLGTTALLALFAAHALANPGVKHTSTTTVKFHGFLGTMMKMGGGNKPQTQTVYVQGNQQRTDHTNDKGELTTSNIVDLDREVFINVNHKKKEYSETTFAEWKAMFEKMKGEGGGKAKEQPKSDFKVEFDVKVDRTNERQTIAGYEAQKAILTMKAKGEQQSSAGAPGASGSMIIVSNHWLAKDVKGYEEMQAFQRAFAQKIGLQFSEAGAQDFMKALSQMNPEMVKSMEKLAEEGKKLEGFALRTETSFETEGGAPTTAGASQSNTQEMPSSVGGLLGGLGKKMAKKPQEGEASGKNVLFESTTETLELKTGTLKADLFGPPAEYKRVEAKK